MLVRCLRFRTSPLLSSSLWFDLSRHCLSSSLLFHSSSSTGGCLSATSNSASSATTTAGGGGAIVDGGGEREWSASLPDGCGGERGEADVVAISLLLCPGGGGATARFSLRRSWGETGGRTTDGRTDGRRRRRGGATLSFPLLLFVRFRPSRYVSFCCGEGTIPGRGFNNVLR